MSKRRKIIDGYMAKPISAPQLRQQIAAILQKRIILL